MRILILNWRDIKNPYSGGAEILTHEIAKYLVKQQHEVTIFTSLSKGSKREEFIDGIKIIRRGQSIAHHIFNSVHYLAFLEYKKNFKGKFDLVIDEVHGLPFFTPWYVSEKKIALVCEVAGGLWIKIFGLFFGTFGRIIEILYIRLIYRNVPFITISNSAREDLIKNGARRDNISIIPVGVNIPKQKIQVRKEQHPTLVFLGRVTKSKGIEEAMHALQILSKSYKAKLLIVGKGDEEYIEFLKKFSKQLKIEDRIVFCGFVSEKEKFTLLSKAWILIHPSKTEGWGINVIEGNSVGTPAVGYNVPGLQDSIQDGKTGLLAGENTPRGLAECIGQLLSDKKLYAELSRNARQWSKRFEWETAGKKTWKIIKDLYEQQK